MNKNINIEIRRDLSTILIDKNENITINELINTYFILHLEEYFSNVNIFIKYVKDKDENLYNRNLEDLLAITLERKSEDKKGIGINDYLNLMNNTKYSRLFIHKIKLQWGNIELKFDDKGCINLEDEIHQIGGEITRIELQTIKEKVYFK